MSYSGFCLLEPEEFTSVSRAYNEGRDAATRGEWERMRLLATISVQPHCKRKLTPDKLFSLPWDRKFASPSQTPVSKEDAKARFEKLVGRSQL